MLGKYHLQVARADFEFWSTKQPQNEQEAQFIAQQLNTYGPALEKATEEWYSIKEIHQVGGDPSEGQDLAAEEAAKKRAEVAKQKATILQRLAKYANELDRQEAKNPAFKSQVKIDALSGKIEKWMTKLGKLEQPASEEPKAAGRAHSPERPRKATQKGRGSTRK
jgi:hypothetical protein